MLSPTFVILEISDFKFEVQAEVNIYPHLTLLAIAPK
jgi:hypothetical protein